MSSPIRKGVQYRKVVARMPEGDKQATAKRGGLEVQIHRHYTEVLDCGCSRDVKFYARPLYLANVVRVRTRGPVRDFQSAFDPVRHLEPSSRVCPIHSYHETTSADERAEYLTRMRSFNMQMRQRAKERGLAFP